MKPNINSVEVHPQLSNNGHPVDDALTSIFEFPGGDVLLVLRLKGYARQSPAKRPIGTPGGPVAFRGVVLDTDEFKYICTE